MVYVDTVQSSNNNNTNSGGLGGQRERQKERGQERERESRAFDADALPPVLKTERVEPSLRRSGALFRQLLCRRFLPPFPHCTFSWNSNVDRNRSKFVSPANWIKENPSPNPKSQIANRNRGIYIPSRRLLSFFSSCPKRSNEECAALPRHPRSLRSIPAPDLGDFVVCQKQLIRYLSRSPPLSTPTGRKSFISSSDAAQHLWPCNPRQRQDATAKDRQRSPTKAAWIGRWNMVLWCYGAMEHGIWYMAMNMQMTDEIFMNAAAPINIIIGPIINAHPYVYKYLGAYVCASMPGCLCCCHSEVSQGFAYKKSNGFMGCQCRWRIESVRSPICICITQWNHFEKSNRRTKYST